VREATALLDLGIAEEYASLSRRYGTADGGGDAWHAYHNADHGRTVGENAGLLASELGLPALDVDLARFAGWRHDDTIDAGAGENERRSAEDAVAWLLARSDIGRDELERKVGLPILGTTWDEERSRQLADPDDVHQAVVADADSSEWGREHGAGAWLRVTAEWTLPLGQLSVPRDLETCEVPYARVLSRLEDGVGWLAADEYLLPEARRRWGDQRRRNGELLAELTEAFRSGQRPFGHLVQRERLGRWPG
jgi:predicted metal-dependent HD superfamily phosphohydrolase